MVAREVNTDIRVPASRLQADKKCRRGRRLNMCMVLPIPTSGDLSGVVKIKIYLVIFPFAEH